MDKEVGKRQVADGVVVLMSVKVVAVVAECLSQAMAVIEHRGYAVKAESVKAELLHPVLAVGEQEMYHVVLAVIEAEAVPSRMFVAFAGIEILVGVASQIAESLHLVLHSVAVYDIHNNGNAVLVCLIDKGLQFLGRSEAAGSSEEAADMIAERSVIRMLLNGHNLNAVISVCLDTGQHVLTKLVVRAHLLCVLRHTDVAFIYKQRRLCRLKRLLLPFILLLRIPYLCGEYLCLLVLHHAVTPCRYSFAMTAVPIDVHLVEVAMLDGLSRELQLPVAMLVKALCLILVRFLPSVEVANEINLCGVRSPLTEHPSACGLMQSVIFVSVGKIGKVLLAVVCQVVKFPQRMIMTSLYSVLVRLQVSVILHQSDMFRSRLCFCCSLRLLCFYCHC